MELVDFTKIPAFVSHVKRQFADNGVDYSRAETCEHVGQTGRRWVAALVAKFTVASIELSEFKGKSMSRVELEEDLIFAKKLLARLHGFKQTLINTLLERYMQIFFPELCTTMAPHQLILPALKYDQALIYLSMMMCNIEHAEKLTRATAVHHKKDIRFWQLLCDDRNLVIQLQVELMPVDWIGTWTELMVCIVDELFPPAQRLRWKEGCFVFPKKNKAPFNIGDDAFLIGHGQLLENGVRIAYGNRGRITLKLFKSKVRLSICDTLVDISTSEVRVCLNIPTFPRDTFPRIGFSAHRLLCARQLSAAPPPLLFAGLKAGDRLFFTGDNQELAKGTVLNFGECGEVLGLAKYERVKKNGLAMYFPGKACIIDCYISQVAVRFSHIYHVVSRAPSCAQLSPFPPSDAQLAEAGRKSRQTQQECAKADAMMAQLVEQEDREKATRRRKKKVSKSVTHSEDARLANAANAANAVIEGGANIETESMEEAPEAPEEASEAPERQSIDDDVPEDFVCSLTLQIMNDPVVAVCCLKCLKLHIHNSPPTPSRTVASNTDERVYVRKARNRRVAPKSSHGPGNGGRHDIKYADSQPTFA